MSASRAYELLLRPAIFQPVGLFTFGLIGYIWIDNRLTLMDTRVTQALDKLNSTNTTIKTPPTPIQIPNNFSQRLHELESTLTSLKNITTNTPQSVTDYTADITAIKSTSDENMTHIQDTFDTLSTQITNLKSISDNNMHDIEQQFNVLTSKMTQIAADNDSDAINDSIKDVKVDIGLLDIVQNEIMNEIGYIKSITDANFAEISTPNISEHGAESYNYRVEINELRNQNEANKQDIAVLNDNINGIKSMTDDNMYDIATQFEVINDDIDSIKNIMDENMSEIEVQFEGLNDQIISIDEYDGVYDALQGVKVDIGLMKLMHDRNMEEIEAKLQSGGTGGDGMSVNVGGDIERLNGEIEGIKSMTDGNMGDISESLEKLNGEVKVIKATVDANMGDIEQEFEVLESKIKKMEANDDIDGVNDAMKEIQTDIGLIKLMHDRNMKEIENKIGSGNIINWGEISNEIYNMNNNIAEHYDALMVAETGFNDLEKRQKVMEWDGEERFDELMKKRSEMDLRLEEMEVELAEHRVAFNIAEDACNELLSWKKEVVTNGV